MYFFCNGYEQRTPTFLYICEIFYSMVSTGQRSSTTTTIAKIALQIKVRSFLKMLWVVDARGEMRALYASSLKVHIQFHSGEIWWWRWCFHLSFFECAKETQRGLIKQLKCVFLAVPRFFHWYFQKLFSDLFWIHKANGKVFYWIKSSFFCTR